MTQTELIRYLEQLQLPGLDYPQPSNRGVIDPQAPLVFSHLDYIQMTTEAPHRWAKDSLSISFLSNLVRITTERHGIRHYRYGANLAPAGTYFWNTANDISPGLLVLTGSDLGILRSMNRINDDQLLKQLMPAARSFTRIDFATSIDRGHPDEILKHFNEGKARTRIRSAERRDNHGAKRGYTVYLGSRDSDKYIRCYDKAAELKLLHVVLTRIEMQCTQEPANRMAKEMMRSGVKKVGKQAIRNFVQFPEIEWWGQATEGDDIDLQLTPAKESSHARWLNEQVLPAIEKRYRAGQEIEAIEEFTRKLLRLQGVLEDGGKEQEEGKTSSG